MATIKVCDICGRIAQDKNTQKSDAQKVLQIIGVADTCDEHYAVADETDWKAYLLKAFDGDDPGGGTYDNPFLWQAGMDVKKGKHYHIYGSEYSAIKDMPNCQIQPTDDGVNWQRVRQYP